MKMASTLVSVMMLLPLPAWAASDPIGDSLVDPLGRIEDIASASVEVDSEFIHVDVDFANSAHGFPFRLSLDTDQDTSTGFQGAFGLNGPLMVNHVLDGSLGTEYIVTWDQNIATLTVFEWDDSTNNIFDVYTDATLPAQSSFSFPRTVVDDDDGLMNYKVLATQSFGANNSGFIYDVLPDSGLAAATTLVVPEADGLMLLWVAALCLGISMRGSRSV